VIPKWDQQEVTTFFVFMIAKSKLKVEYQVVSSLLSSLAQFDSLIETRFLLHIMIRKS
jgi:hypothetical protein